MGWIKDTGLELGDPGSNQIFLGTAPISEEVEFRGPGGIGNMEDCVQAKFIEGMSQPGQPVSHGDLSILAGIKSRGKFEFGALLHLHFQLANVVEVGQATTIVGLRSDDRHMIGTTNKGFPFSVRSSKDTANMGKDDIEEHGVP